MWSGGCWRQGRSERPALAVGHPRSPQSLKCKVPPSPPPARGCPSASSQLPVPLPAPVSKPCWFGPLSNLASALCLLGMCRGDRSPTAMPTPAPLLAALSLAWQDHRHLGAPEPRSPPLPLPPDGRCCHLACGVTPWNLPSCWLAPPMPLSLLLPCPQGCSSASPGSRACLHLRDPLVWMRALGFSRCFLLSWATPSLPRGGGAGRGCPHVPSALSEPVCTPLCMGLDCALAP